MTVYLITVQPFCEIIISFLSFPHQDMNMPGLSTISDRKWTVKTIRS